MKKKYAAPELISLTDEDSIVQGQECVSGPAPAGLCLAGGTFVRCSPGNFPSPV